MPRHKTFVITVAIILLAGLSFFTYESRSLATAHSTFENYYAFRGCTELVDRTDTYGDCRLRDGSTIRIVKFDKKWFLEDDLPECGLYIRSICLFTWP